MWRNQYVDLSDADKALFQCIKDISRIISQELETMGYVFRVTRSFLYFMNVSVASMPSVL